MMTFLKAVSTSDGQVFEKLEDAQVHEIHLLIDPDFQSDKVAGIEKPCPSIAQVASFIVTAKDKVLDILSTTPRSLPKARKINGGTKRRASKSQEQPAPAAQ